MTYAFLDTSLRRVALSGIFAMLAAMVVIALPQSASAQVGACGGTIATGIDSFSCTPTTVVCPSTHRAFGGWSAPECPVNSGDYYGGFYGGCAFDNACAFPAPTVSLVANPNPVYQGDNALLTWSTTGATSCTSSDFSTGGATSGAVNVAPLASRQYTVTCVNSIGTATVGSVWLNVAPPPLAAACSPNKTTAAVGESVTWTATAWNGTPPYSFAWIGQMLAGLTGPSRTVAYDSPGTKIASIDVTDSSTLGAGISTTISEGDMCAGPMLIDHIPSPGTFFDERTGWAWVEDGGTPANAQNWANFAVEDPFYYRPGGQTAAEYAIIDDMKVNPQNYCTSMRISGRLTPMTWYYYFRTSVHATSAKRGLQASDMPLNPSDASISATATGVASPGVPRQTSAVCSAPVSVSAPAAPTAALSASPISIIAGQSSTLTWSSTNATSCAGTNFSTGGAPSGSLAVTPGVTTTYSLTCTGPGGTSPAQQATVTVLPALSDITADTPPNLAAIVGQPVNLSVTVRNASSNSTLQPFPALLLWSTTIGGPETIVRLFKGATALGIPNGFPGNYGEQASGSFTPTAAGTFYYRLCSDLDDTWTGSINESNEGNNCSGWGTVTVSNPAPTGVLSCAVSNTNPPPNTSVTYTVTPSNGATGPYTWNDTQGGSYGSGASVNRLIPGAGPYVMFVSGQNVASQPVACPAVSGTCPNPTATISASPTRVREGETATITWSASGVDTSCTITGPGVSQTIPGGSCVIPNGSATPVVTTQSVYRITCDGGESSAEAIVNVIPRFTEF